MDISGEKYNPDGNRLARFSVVLQTVRSIFRRLVDFFTLTEEDRSNAGVYFSDEGRTR
jgi:hypothetical protein